MAPATIWHLRTASATDQDFLYRLHCVTMRDIIEKTWGRDEAWQRGYLEQRFRDELVSIIEVEDKPIGTLCLKWKPDALHIHEVQILPEFQGRGIGTAVIQNAIQQGAVRGLPVTLAVVPANSRAKRLYERLGFKVTSVEEPFIRMKHDPQFMGHI